MLNQHKRHKRLPDCHPIRYVNYPHFMWPNLDYGWMHAWKQHNEKVSNDCLNYYSRHFARHQIQYIITSNISSK